MRVRALGCRSGRNEGKRMMLRKSAAVLVLGMGLFIGAAQAQTSNANGIKWVDVNVSNVASELAKSLKVEVGQIPGTVQVPVKIAASVCGIEENALAKAANSGNAQCTAKSSSRALSEFVQKKIGKA
jgi:hypothetical protein